ncbi:MAG: galactonate dehydratase [Firmicutes bacterium]|nr:galactonate dehydratase [Bacillota bacterium]
MKITKLELFKVAPRWLFLKISTDEGICGWGEPVLEGRAETVRQAVLEVAGQLIGKDPRRIEDIWHMLYRGGFYRGGGILMSAISGIDQALWDIKGKWLGVPVYELLGGKCREKVKVYGWIGGDRPSDAVAGALERKTAGYQAVKMNGTTETGYIDSYDKIDEVVERMAAVREAVGKDFGIGIDFHGRVHKSMARILAKELEPYRPMFIEEPLLPENLDELKTLVHHTTIPIATGERLYSRWDYKRLFEEGLVDIIQPDLSHAGGITEVKKLAAVAESYDVAVAPHCPLGPIALASCFAIDACCHNAVIQEQSLGMQFTEEMSLTDYLKNPEMFSYENGYMKLTEGAGLGVDINEELVREMDRKGHSWKNPIWRNEDGSVAEW